MLFFQNKTEPYVVLPQCSVHADTGQPISPAFRPQGNTYSQVFFTLCSVNAHQFVVPFQNLCYDHKVTLSVILVFSFSACFSSFGEDWCSVLFIYTQKKVTNWFHAPLKRYFISPVAFLKGKWLYCAFKMNLSYVLGLQGTNMDLFNITFSGNILLKE